MCVGEWVGHQGTVHARDFHRSDARPRTGDEGVVVWMVVVPRRAINRCETRPWQQQLVSVGACAQTLTFESRQERGESFAAKKWLEGLAFPGVYDKSVGGFER